MKKIVMVGCHEAGWYAIRQLLLKGLVIHYFVTITKEKAVQQKVSGYKSFIDLANEFNIPIYYARKYSLKDELDINFFKANKFDLLIQGGWQRLFPNEILNTLTIGAIGGHGSVEFLPRGRGRSPINWSLIEGQKRFIMQYFLIKDGVDDGDIFHYEMFDINEWDDCNTLYYKNSIVTERFFLNFIDKLFYNDVKFLKQQGIPTYYKKREMNDGKIDWNKSLFEIYNFIRALTHPYPGSFTFFNNKKVIIWKAQPFDTRIDSSEFAIGEICYIFDGKLVVKSVGGLLLITEYSFEDNNSLTLIIGDKFE
jgi:methionyl-tRNA formyltransferase